MELSLDLELSIYEIAYIQNLPMQLFKVLLTTQLHQPFNSQQSKSPASFSMDLNVK